MSETSHIVYGGGWKTTCTHRIKIKSWMLLFAAIGLASFSKTVLDVGWGYAVLPSGVLFALSAIFFFRERPVEVKLPRHRAGHDLRKLYGTSSTIDDRKDVSC